MRRTKPLVERNPRSLRPTTVFLDSFMHDHDSDLKFWEDFLQRVIPGHSGATMLPRSEARTACFSSAHAGEFYLSAVLADQFDPECSSSDASSVGVSIWKEQSGLGISNPDPFLLAVLIPRAAGARLVRLTPLTHPKLFQFCTAQLAAGRLVFRVGAPAHVLTQLFSHPEFPSVTRSRP